MIRHQIERRPHVAKDQGADTIKAFRAAMCDAGITPPDYITADGRIHRFRVEGDKPGSKNGWYCLHLDRRPAGAFGSWKLGISSTWRADGQPMTHAERESISALLKAARMAADTERRAEHERRAVEARAEWAQAAPADRLHPYLLKKHVQPHDLRQRGGMLLVPLLDHHSTLWNVQRIDAGGGKRFLPGRAGGLFCPIGSFTAPQKILVCEGFATGATLYEQTRHPVLCAMNAGNLLPVAKAAREMWPGAELVIAADNDRRTPGNPGVTAATAAAKAVGARLLVPQFADDECGSDWNDFAALRRQEAQHG